MITHTLLDLPGSSAFVCYKKASLGIFDSPKRIDSESDYENRFFKNRNQRLDFERIDLKNRIKISKVFSKLSNIFYTVFCNNF